jgi:hypothetical protein
MSLLLDTLPSPDVKRRPFTCGAQLNTSPASISRRPPLALDLAPSTYQTGSYLSMLLFGPGLRLRLSLDRVCSLCSIHGIYVRRMCRGL